MDSSATIQMGRFEQPQVVGVKVAKRHRQFLELLALKIKSSDFGVSLMFFFFVGTGN